MYSLQKVQNHAAKVGFRKLCRLSSFSTKQTVRGLLLERCSTSVSHRQNEMRLLLAVLTWLLLMLMVSRTACDLAAAQWHVFGADAE